MANHLRRQVREAVATLLTGLATTGSRVYQSRVQPLSAAQLPGLVILTNNEDIEQSTIGGMLERRLQVEVIGKVKASADVDDKLDDIAKEVEVKVYSSVTNNTLTGLIKSLDLKSIDVGINGETDQKVGEIRMQFEAVYFNQAATPDVSA